MGPVALEMTKIAVIRDGPHRTLEPDRDLRLRGREADMLLLDWIDPATGTANIRIGVPHALYEDVLDAPAAWEELRAEVAGRMFVDIGRILRDGGEGAGGRRHERRNRPANGVGCARPRFPGDAGDPAFTVFPGRWPVGGRRWIGWTSRSSLQTALVRHRMMICGGSPSSA